MADVLAGAGGELAAGGGVAVERGGDLGEVVAEDVVQEEGGALERREALEGEHEGEGDVLVSCGVVVDQGVGEPGADVGLALVLCGLELVEAEADDGAAEEGGGLLDGGAVGAQPAEEGVLDGVLGVGDGAGHAVGEAREGGAEGLEGGGGVVGGGHEKS